MKDKSQGKTIMVDEGGKAEEIRHEAPGKERLSHKVR